MITLILEENISETLKIIIFMWKITIFQRFSNEVVGRTLPEPFRVGLDLDNLQSYPSFHYFP